MIYYIQQFTMSMWPDGKLAETEPSRSDEEKLKTRMEAKEKFLQNMPGTMLRKTTLHILIMKIIYPIIKFLFFYMN